MKIAILLVFISFLCSFNPDDSIKNIQLKCKNIDASIEKMQHLRINDAYLQSVSSTKGEMNPNVSNESKWIYNLAIINLDKFLDNNVTKKIVVKFEGVQEDLKSEYYYSDSSLIFVRKLYYGYAKSKWDSLYNYNDRTELTNELYFKSDELIRIEDNGQIIRIETKEEMERKILSDSKLYLNYKENKTPY